METFSALLAICAGHSPVPGEFPAQRPVTRHFDVFFDLRTNKLLSKQSWGWWIETPLPPLWRHRNDSSLMDVNDSSMIYFKLVWTIKSCHNGFMIAPMSCHALGFVTVFFSWGLGQFQSLHIGWYDIIDLFRGKNCYNQAFFGLPEEQSFLTTLCAADVEIKIKTASLARGQLSWLCQYYWSWRSITLNIFFISLQRYRCHSLFWHYELCILHFRFIAPLQ